MADDTNEAMEMLGKGYSHEYEPKETWASVSGYTPTPDVLCRRYGYITALVWGIMWRFSQGRDGVCRASLEKISGKIGISERTLIRHIQPLLDDEYLIDTTPDLKNKPHIYKVTDKLRLAFASEIVESGVTESQRAMTESQRQGDRESVEDTNKREKKKDLVDGLLELYRMPGAKKVIVKQYIESQIKVRMTWNPTGKDAEAFINHAADCKIKEGQEIDKFIDYWLANYKDRQYWSFRKMLIEWPAAFSASPQKESEPQPTYTVPASWEKYYADAK